MLLAAAPTASAQISYCPDMRAVDRSQEITDSTAGMRCRLALSIFGLEIGFGPGGHCPATRTITPAHRECEFVRNAGTDCKPTEALEVVVLACDCVLQFDPVLVAFSADCNCRSWGTAGFVFDSESIHCDIGW